MFRRKKGVAKKTNKILEIISISAEYAIGFLMQKFMWTNKLCFLLPEMEMVQLADITMII